MSQREESESESVLLYHCPTCGATHLDPVEDGHELAALATNLILKKEIGGLKQQLAEARAEVDRLAHERERWIKHCRAMFERKKKYREQCVAQAAEIERLRKVEKLLKDTIEELARSGRMAVLRAEAAEKQVATATVIFNDCRENDNHWGDVEVENHRLKGDLAAQADELERLREQLSEADWIIGLTNKQAGNYSEARHTLTPSLRNSIHRYILKWHSTGSET